MALQLRLQQVRIAVHVHAQFFQNLGILDEAHILIGKVGVIAVGFHGALVGILGGVLLQQVQVLVAVGLGQAAEDHVRLGILFFRIHPGRQFAQGAADKLDLHIGIGFIEDFQEHFVVYVRLGGVDHHRAGQSGIVAFGGGLVPAAGCQGQDHRQGQQQT